MDTSVPLLTFWKVSMYHGIPLMHGCSVISTLCDPMGCRPPGSHQIPFLEFSKKDYWSRLPFPSPRDLLNPGIKLLSLAFPALGGGVFLLVEPPGNSVTLSWCDSFEISSRFSRSFQYLLGFTNTNVQNVHFLLSISNIPLICGFWKHELKTGMTGVQRRYPKTVTML